MTVDLQKYGITPGSVLLDLAFVFSSDNQISQKWIIILSGNIDDSLIFVLTTSKVNVYLGSLRQHIKVKAKDEPCFKKDCIIEIERTDVLDVERLLKKYDEGKIKNKGRISDKLFKKILEEIAECPVIPEYIKENLSEF
jgi:hypothetical protein